MHRLAGAKVVEWIWPEGPRFGGLLHYGIRWNRKRCVCPFVYRCDRELEAGPGLAQAFDPAGISNKVGSIKGDVKKKHFSLLLKGEAHTHKTGAALFLGISR
jgi:hypothetical protein